MSNQSKDRKISQFLGNTSIPSGSYLTFVSGGTNYKILASDLLTALGVTGTIVQDGDPLGVPVLDKSGSINNIRNVEPGSGISASVSAQNGITIKHNFSEDTTGVELVTDITAASPKFRSLIAGSGINIAGSGDQIQVSLSAIPVSTKTVIVNSVSDFPAAVSGVITLADDTEYAIRNDITTSSRFVLGNNTVLTGSNNLVVSLTYTGSGVFLTSVNKSWTLRDLTVGCASGTFISFGGSGSEIIQLENCVITAGTMGTIGNFAGLHFDNTQFNVTTDGFTFTGTNGVALLESNLTTIDAGILYDLGAATFTAFSVTDSFATLNGTSNFISGLASSGNIGVGNLGSVHNCRFFGAGSPLVTISEADDRWQFYINDVIPDSTNDALISLVSNATNTVISGAGAPVQIAGTWNEEHVNRFTTDAAGTITYTGEKDIEADITASFSLAPVAGTNKDIKIYPFINAAEVTNAGAASTISSGSPRRVTVIWKATLSKNDTIDMRVENNTDTTDILVTDAVVRIS